MCRKILRIKVDDFEFKSAELHKNAFGYITTWTNTNQKRTFYIYVELGEKGKYISSPKDDPKTKYALFVNCIIYVSKTDKRLDQQQYDYVSKINKVILFC